MSHVKMRPFTNKEARNHDFGQNQEILYRYLSLPRHGQNLSSRAMPRNTLNDDNVGWNNTGSYYIRAI